MCIHHPNSMSIPMKNPMRCVSRHHWDHPGSRPDFQVPRLPHPLGLGYFGMAVPDLLSILWLKLRSTEFWIKYLFFAMFRDVFEYILSKAYEKDMVWFILKSLLSGWTCLKILTLKPDSSQMPGATIWMHQLQLVATETNCHYPQHLFYTPSRSWTSPDLNQIPIRYDMFHSPDLIQ